jgi:hypothetical protein
VPPSGEPRNGLETFAASFAKDTEVISTALHQLEPARATLHGQFSPDLQPALTVDSGDTVRYCTLGVAWGLENHTEGDLPRRKFEPREFRATTVPAWLARSRCGGPSQGACSRSTSKRSCRGRGAGR